jgi:hypothetical protein
MFMKRMALLIGVCLIPFFISNSYTPVYASPDFPIGLNLEYHKTVEVDDSVIDVKDFRYEVLRWATEVGTGIVEINETITEDSASVSEIVYYQTATWDVYYNNGSATGSYLGNPLWMDISGWSDGATVSIPASGSHTSSYSLNEFEEVTCSAGTYLCWQASWHDEYAGWDRWKDLYYDKDFGVKIWDYGYAMYDTVSTQRIDMKLTSSNLDSFITVPLPLPQIPGFPVVAIALGVALAMGFTMLRRRTR